MISLDESGEGSKEGNGNGRIIGGNGNERIEGGNYTSGSMEGMSGANQDKWIHGGNEAKGSMEGKAKRIQGDMDKKPVTNKKKAKAAAAADL